MTEELNLTGDEPVRYVDADGTVVYRISGLGGCIRALIAAGSDYSAMPHPAWFQEVLDEGTAAEAVINAEWERQTDMPTTAIGQRVELEIGVIDGKRVVARGHIDGLRGLDPVVREYKKLRDSTWGHFQTQGVECQPTYPWQTSGYMFATGADEVEFVGGHWDSATQTLVEVECKHITSPPIPLRAIKLKIAEVEHAINNGEHPYQHPCGPKMYPCPYYQLHDEGEDDTTRIRLDSRDIQEMVEELGSIDILYSAAKREADRLDKERRNIKQKITTWALANRPNEQGKGKVKTDKDFIDGDYEVKDWYLTMKRIERKAHPVSATEYQDVSLKHKEI